MTALRGTAARVARLRRSLSELDRHALESLERLRLLTTEHLQRLHVIDGSSATRSRRTRVLLRRLTDRGLIVGLPRDIGGDRAGSAQTMFCLSQLGQAVLAAPGKVTRRRMVWQTKPYFQDHMLAVSEVYVRVAEACQLGQAELLTFDAEPSCWRRFTGNGGQLITLKPDAYVRVGVDGYELSSFVEVDLDSESLPTIRRKCQLYINYWRTGLEQQAYAVFPRVVWLVPDERRLKDITGVLQRLTADTQGLFMAAVAADGSRLLTTLPAAWQASGGTS